MQPASENKIPKRPLAPKALARFDHWLLKNYPDTWSARTHLLLYYALLFAAAVFLLSLLPDDARSRSYVEIWVTSVGLLSGIGLIVWLVYLFRFNVFKRFGALAPGDRLRNFLVFYFSLLVFSSFVYIPFVGEKLKADAAYTDDEITHDINEVNYCTGLLEKSAFNLVLKTDTVILARDEEDAQRKNAEHYDSSGYSNDQYGKLIYISETGNDLEWRKTQADSFREIGPGRYVFVTIPNLQHLSVSNYNNSEELPRRWNNLQLYYKIYRDRPLYSSEEAQAQIKKVNAKYYYGDYSRWYGSPEYRVALLPDGSNLAEYIRESYKLWPTNYSMDNIVRRKHRFSSRDITDFCIGTLYFVLGLTILLFAFRHMTVKTFFISIVAGIILAIFSGLMLVLSGFNEIGALVLIFLYYIAFTAIASTIRYSKVRSLIKGVALNFSLTMTYSMPVAIVGFYYAILHRQYEYSYDSAEYLERFADEKLHFQLAQYAGIVLLLTMIAFVYSRWYKTWYSQPEE